MLPHLPMRYSVMELAVPKRRPVPSFLSPSYISQLPTHDHSTPRPSFAYTGSATGDERRQFSPQGDEVQSSRYKQINWGKAKSPRPRPEQMYQHSFHISQQVHFAAHLDQDNTVEYQRDVPLYAKPASPYAGMAAWPRRTIMACMYCRQRKVSRV